MKFGFRTPSLTRRIAARTSVKRYIRHSLGFKAPRGWGWVTNPKKAAYNRVYNRTTVDPIKLLSGGGRRRSKSSPSGVGCLAVLGILALLGLIQNHPWIIVVAVVVGLLVLVARNANQQGQAAPEASGLDDSNAVFEAAELDQDGSLLELPGVGPKMAQTLAEAGYSTPADIRAARDEDLLLVKGLGPGTLRKIRSYLGQ